MTLLLSALPLCATCLLPYARPLVLVVALLLLARIGSRWLARPRPFPLDGKVVVITGAAHGIGRGLAERVWQSAAGVTLVLLDLNAAALDAARAHLQQQQQQHAKPAKHGATATADRAVDTRRVLVFTCDVSDEAAVEACVAEVVAAVAPKPIAVLVNNAGVVSGRSVMELKPAQVRRTFGVNVFAHFWLVKSVLPSMKTCEDALIVTVSSITAFVPGARLSDYAASKAATTAFHSCLRLELLHDGLTNIRTLLVCPHAVRTGMFDGIFDTDHGYFNLQQRLLPMLTQDQAVSRIHRAMFNGEQLVVSCLPGWLGALHEWTTPIYSLLPMPARDFLAVAFGAVHGMDSFVGHTTDQSAVARNDVSTATK